jgi:hypothetical protein
MRWVGRFPLICAALIALGLLALWGLDGFSSLGVEGHVAVAMWLGIVFTIAVGVVLMGLIFYGHCAGYDEAAHGLSIERPADSDTALPNHNDRASRR